MTAQLDAGIDLGRARELRARARRLEERAAQLEIERDAARAANRARSRFFAQLSHELRTPLDAVIGLTDAVLRGSLESDQHERLIEVLLAAETLLGVVNDLLDYARIEADDVALERVPFDLHDAVFDTVASVAGAAEARGIELACGVDPGIPPLLVGDPGRLRHVLGVLLRNAVRFTERGEVVAHFGLGAQGEQIVLEGEVRDSGVGIEAERLPGLFEALPNPDPDGDEREDPAAVLGLPLCRKLVERMGGELRVESVPGAGSTFAFSACVEVTEGVHDRHRRAPRPLAGIRVLIADDHDATARLLVEQAGGWGMLPAAASSAKDVIARLTETADGDASFRLLLVDAQLPDTGGLELVERLRNDPRFEALVVLVLHTATRPASPDLARRLSIAAQLPKPVHPTQLFESLMQALEISLPPTPPRYRYRSTRDELRLDTRPPLASASPAWVPPSRILVVDDSPGTLEVIQTILEDQGHTIETADGGRHALERFQAGRFDVVLLDLQMPGMDGFEVCAAFRAREAGTGHRVPIIAMTANALRGDRERSLVAGMNHFITKPVRRGELFAVLLEARGPALREALRPSRSGPVEIDWSAMSGLVDGDRDLLREVVEAYVVEIRDHLERLPIEIDARNLPEARRRAHSLRGAMGVFRATAAEAAAARLEAATSAGDFGTAATLVEAVRTAVGEVLPLLEAHLRDA